MLSLRSRILQNDSKHPLLVGASLIGMERLSLANHGAMPGERLGEGLEAAIRIDVIDDERAARP
jgi:hypothetical protein